MFLSSRWIYNNDRGERERERASTVYSLGYVIDLIDLIRGGATLEFSLIAES